MDLNALKDFHLIATSGGIGAASRASGRPKATLSRRLAELEEALGVRLIERGSRRLEITEAGQLLLSRTIGPLSEIDEAVTLVREGSAKPRGHLRIAAPVLFSQIALGRLAARFCAIYPEVRIEVVSEDRLSDLVDEHFDIAIRVNPNKESVLVGRCFARDRLILAASPMLDMPKDDSGLPVPVPAVVMPSYQDGETWTLHNGQLCFSPQPVMRLSSLLTLRDAVTAGAGAAILPQSIISNQLESGELVSWGEVGNPTELWILHTSRRLQSPKVRAFIDFICKQYPDGWFIT